MSDSPSTPAELSARVEHLETTVVGLLGCLQQYTNTGHQANFRRQLDANVNNFNTYLANHRVIHKDI